MQADALGRLKIYAHVVGQVVEDIRGMMGARVDDPMLWIAIKAVYSSLIADRQDWELAETFHNSVTSQVFDTVGVDDRIEFVDTDFDSPPSPSSEPVYVIFDREETTRRAGGVDRLTLHRGHSRWRRLEQRRGGGGRANRSPAHRAWGSPGGGPGRDRPVGLLPGPVGIHRRSPLRRVGAAPYGALAASTEPTGS